MAYLRFSVIYNASIVESVGFALPVPQFSIDL